jgi:hypothetical protein
MKQLKTIIIASLALVFLTFGGAMAGDHPTGGQDHPVGDHPKGHEEHPTQQGMDHSSSGQKMEDMDHSTHGADMGDMDHSSHKGENIRNVTVDGFKLAYHLVDMQEKIKAMKAAGHDHEMNMTHHLMVYVTDSDGNSVASARVGYFVELPDGSSQKLMCMGMGGGYGSDVNFSAPGTYTVKAKVVTGEKKFMDSFSYTVK